MPGMCFCSDAAEYLEMVSFVLVQARFYDRVGILSEFEGGIKTFIICFLCLRYPVHVAIPFLNTFPFTLKTDRLKWHSTSNFLS